VKGKDVSGIEQGSPPAGIPLSFFTDEERKLLLRYRDARQLSEADEALLTKIGSAVVRLNVDSVNRRAGGEHRRLVAGDLSALPGHDAIARLKKIEPLGTKYRVLCGRGHPCPAEIALAISSYFEAIDDYDPKRETPHSGAEFMETSAYNLSRDAEWRLVAPSIFGGNIFEGFERVPGGLFKVIRSRKERDEFGKLSSTRTGRRLPPFGFDWHVKRSANEGVESGNHTTPRHPKGMVGWCPSSPAVIICHKCGTFNLVSEPPPPHEDIIRRVQRQRDEWRRGRP
jgi:hypothetical protein